uniref:hypothetical protein n=1 Tax=Bacteroides fragilis TaxID=817 RepID=UPI003569C67D
MTLQELESKLGYLRKEKQLKLSFPQNVSPLQNITYDNIENHKNYNITTLMLYINALGFALSVNDETVADLEQFGKILVAIRNEIGLSQLGILTKTSLTQSRISSIEKGRGYQRKSLVTYLSVLPDVNFELIDKYGLLQ